VDLKQETENALISETCGNNVDDNADGMIATSSDEGCAPTTTNTNAVITDISTNSDTNANTTDTTYSDTNANTTDVNTNTTTTPPASETCDIGADNSTDGTIASISNEDCTPTTAPVSDTCDNGVDNNATDTTNGTTTVACTPPVSEPCVDGIGNNVTGTTTVACTPPVSEPCVDGIGNNVTGTTNGTTTVACPLLEPTVVIDSAVDQAGNDLSPGDLISPQKVTFTFSAHASNTTESLAEKGPQGYVFECALDDESYSSCNSPMTYDMTAGKHNFEVRLVS
jgi:hypothetical protein